VPRTHWSNGKRTFRLCWSVSAARLSPLSETFADGVALLRAAEEHCLVGVVSKRRDAPYRSGDYRDWRKVKTTAWRESNRERWRLFEQGLVTIDAGVRWTPDFCRARANGKLRQPCASC
jgi:hypothetical protein